MVKILNQIKNFFSGNPLRIWGAVAIAFAILLFIILVICICRDHKKVDAESKEQQNTDLANDHFQIEIGNCQGIGDREEQQDAFAFSPSKYWKDKGFLAVLCDGMGGLDSGAAISNKLVSDIISEFPYDFDALKDGWILNSFSREIYDLYRGRGGTTLIITYIKNDQMWFASVGDSDLLLYRNGRIYSMNERQEYGNSLLRRAADGAISVSQALENSDAPALTEYMGAKEVHADFAIAPFKVQDKDVFLLCSDGISDTLSFDEIKEAMSTDSNTCADLLEKGIMKKNRPHQDNYTAIVFSVHEIGGNTL